MTNRITPTSPDPIPREYQKLQWKVTGHVMKEGDVWIEGDSTPPDAAAIRYENGWVFDFVLKRLGQIPWRHVDD